MKYCVGLLVDTGYPVNASGLAAELEERVFVGGGELQTFVDRHPYVTRMFAQVSPPNMTRDPYFAFDSNLPDVIPFRWASGYPVCQNGTSFAMDIILDDGTSTRVAPVYSDCYDWVYQYIFRTPPPSSVSPAILYGAAAFARQAANAIRRRNNGTFDEETLMDLLASLGNRTVDQTVVPYSRTAGPTSTRQTKAPTKVPNNEPPTKASTTPSKALLSAPTTETTSDGLSSYHFAWLIIMVTAMISTS